MLIAVVFLTKAGGNIFWHANITGVLSLQLLYVSWHRGTEGLAQRACSVGKEKLIRKRINHGACEKKAVKNTRVDSLCDYSEGFFFLIDLLRKMPNICYFRTQQHLPGFRYLHHISSRCLKCSRSLILPVMVLYSLHLVC